MAIDKDLLDRLLEGREPSGLFARDGLLDDLKKALSERILNAERDEPLGAEQGEAEALRRPNRRNGSLARTVLTGTHKAARMIPCARPKAPRRAAEHAVIVREVTFARAR